MNEYGKYPRTWNLEHAIEVQHELMPNLSVSAGWWHGDFHNLTTTVNQSWSLADYTPYTWYNPTTGDPFTVYARSAAASARPTRNLDTYDPDRKDVYESYNFEGRYRIPGGGQVFGGISIERERYKACTAPDDPNYQSTTAGTYNGVGLCDDFANDIPFRPSFKMSGTKEVGYGINLSVAFQNNASPASSRVMTVTRGTTRYPANCPSPCPAGEIIMPTRRLRPDDADLRPRAAARLVGRAHRAARLQGLAHVQIRPLQRVAHLRSVQREQLGRDHQLHHDEHAIHFLPCAEQHHAGADVRARRGSPLVTTDGPQIRHRLNTD